MLRICCLLLILFTSSKASISQCVVPGAGRMDQYFPLLKAKRVALVMNQTSEVGGQLLADTLQKRGVQLVRIFVPEHGFRGVGDAGAHISNSVDAATGLPIVSLYGNNKKPPAAQLTDIDVVIYDLQDVGTRFYTYISTLQYVMEACIENDKKFIILDRPNPNGGYIDGPVLDTALRSFVGMQPIPVVYGMTAGEYAKMLVGEKWIKNAEKLRMDVMPCLGWDHRSNYALPVAPSPNLKTMEAIYLYPSLCFFEGTVISVGRGTDKPFQQWGNPEIPKAGMDSFLPQSTIGATKPPFEGKTCYGRIASDSQVSAATRNLEIGFLLEMYRLYPNKEKFFNPFFEKLAGTRQLRQQIIDGLDATAIKASWAPGIKAFQKTRKKYLLYADFE